MAFTQMELAAAILDIVPQMDVDVVTIRIVMEKLAARFGVDLQTIRTQKAVIKQLLMNSYGQEEPGQNSNAEKENAGNQRGRLQASPVKRKHARKANAISDESDNEEDEASEQDNEEEEADDDSGGSEAQASDSDSDTPKRKRASSKPTSAKRKAPAATREKKKSTPPAKKPRQTASTDSPGIAALKEMARAARLLSPRVYSGLKKLDSQDEQEGLIRDLLRTSGIKFSGRYPQKREIDDVRRKKDLEKDLEGIDTSLIIEDTSSRSRRARGAISYADQLRNRPVSDEEEEDVVEQEDGEGSETNESKPVLKKRKKDEETEEEEEDEDDAFEANDSDSSEAEF